MNEHREALTEILKNVAASHQPMLEETVRARLDEREQRVLDWLMRQYQDETKRRWYDPYHILFSTYFALELINRESLDRLIVSGILLHDIGYFALTDKSQWSSPYSRITHMQEGTALAARVLSEQGYTATELEKVLGMIAVHDNPYLSIPIEGNDRLGLRDCDRAWVMHPLSFYKDICSKQARFEQPISFLHDRLLQFYGWKQPFGEVWAATIEKIKQNAQRIEPPTYTFTQQIIKRQFACRIQELQQDNLLGNPEQFKAYLSRQIENE